MEDEKQNRLFMTTDEGSNVLQQGGDLHINCVCHFASLLAKRSTQPYKNSDLGQQIKDRVGRVHQLLGELEQFVRRLKFLRFTNYKFIFFLGTIFSFVMNATIFCIHQPQPDGSHNGQWLEVFWMDMRHSGNRSKTICPRRKSFWKCSWKNRH